MNDKSIWRCPVTTRREHNHEDYMEIISRRSLYDRENDGESSDTTSVKDQNRVKYRSSLKGSYQLVLDGYPYTRHRIRGGTIYWRCVQFRPLNCKARVRTNPSGDRVSIVDEDHNHGILKERRKKGSLKIVYEQRKLAKEKNA